MDCASGSYQEQGGENNAAFHLSINNDDRPRWTSPAGAARTRAREPMPMTEGDDTLQAAERAFNDAQALMREGRPAAAWTRLQQALALAPAHPETLYVSGVLAHGAGRFGVAGRLLRRARSMIPRAPEIAFALGNLSLDLGDPPAAEALFRDVVRLSPSFAAGRRALAQALAQQRRHEEAESELARLIAADPLSADASIDLATLLLRRGADAEVLLQRAAAAAPDHPRAHFLIADVRRRGGWAEAAAITYARSLALDARNAYGWQGLGLALTVLKPGPISARVLLKALALNPADDTSWFALAEADRAAADWPLAIVRLRRTLACAPGRLDAMINLGNALDELDDRGSAAAVLSEALRQSPGDPKILSNLATVLLQDGDVGEASRLYRMAVTLKPDDPVAHYNLGNAGRQRLELGDALRRYGRATDLDPAYSTPRWNDAITRLMAGDWTTGFFRYEWRWRDLESPIPIHAPWWQGEPLAGRRIVLLGEQGFGDMIHFARYARAVVENGGRVVLECYPQLRRLFSTLSQGIELIDLGASPGQVDLQAALMQLPPIFGSTPAGAYAPIPYLTPPADGPRLLPSGSARFKVGLVWAGNPRIEKFHKRSATLAEFAPLLDVPGVAAYSLQIGPRAADVGRLGLQDRIQDLAPLVRDFADTAALIDQLDLVIAVDTAVAHLAGALGKPVWMLPTYVPDWRWLLGREDTPWYPTMRLYRQGEDRRWPPVIARIVRDLAAVASPA